jgi:uncharacterized alpha-E superfamily protein
VGNALSKPNRLYWLGRYNERVYTSLKYMLKVYDTTIDGEPVDYPDICERLEMPCVYRSSEDFFQRYVFDIDNYDSIARSADYMLGNGMVLRETLSSETLSYLQMAVNALTLGATSPSPAVSIQWVLDDIMAFRGSYQDYMVDETLRNIIRCGISVERISMYGRLSINPDEAVNEVKKLVGRMHKTTLSIYGPSEDVLLAIAMGNTSTRPAQVVKSVESLFVV